MRVAINCRSFLKKQYAGIGRYSYNLVKHLSEIDSQNQYFLYTPKRLFDFKRETLKAPAANFIVKGDPFNRGPAKSLPPVDVYHSPSLDFLDEIKAKVIVTVHDVIYKTHPQGHTPDALNVIDKQMRAAVSRAEKIICCSQSTLEDLKKFFDVDEEKLRLIYQGVDKNVFYPLKEEERKVAQAALKAKGIEPPFLLFVGTIEPRKNIQNLLKAFVILKETKKFGGKLVIAGMKGWMMEDLGSQIERLGLSGDCLLPGYVTDEELRFLYNWAQAFVFPSFYEGFGFPIVEALSCGAAVVTSNVSSCKEIAADAAQTVDPNDPEVIANAVLKIIEDKEFRQGLQKKALERSKVFSFRDTAEQTLEVYQALANA
jgi:glycosyltransferase involved in cell wall biosynthesis